MTAIVFPLEARYLFASVDKFSEQRILGTAVDEEMRVVWHQAVDNYFELKDGRELQKLQRDPSSELDVEEDGDTIIRADREEIPIESLVREVWKSRGSVCHEE